MTPRSTTTRVIARTLVLSQLFGAVPVFAAEPKRAQATQPVTEAARPADEPRKPANRTVPKVTPPPTVASLSASPSDAELTRTRIFPEPLIPMPRATTAAENAALARAIGEYARTADSEKVAPLLAFLAAYPRSAWRASLLANLGTAYRGNGYIGRALNAWELAWVEAKSETEPRAKAVADFALGEWLDQSAKIGHATEIAARLDQIGGRSVAGRASQKVSMAREALWVLKFHHEEAAASGPAALESILGYASYARKEKYTPTKVLRHYHAMPSGTSLRELQALAKRVGLHYEVVFHPRNAAFPVPSVIHWRVDHYSALVKEENGRYLLFDPILGGEKWVTREALDEETSGYVLAPKSSLDASWRVVAAAEAGTVIGHCAPGAPDDADPGPPGPLGCGMAEYSLQMMPASLRLRDTPVNCDAPVGPPTRFQVTYNQREGGQPQLFSYGNLGPKWTFDWLAWVTDDPNSADVQADVALRGGGSEHYTGGAGSGVYAAHWRSRAVLAKVSASPIRYERRLRDGGVEVFAQSDGVISAGRHVYLTDVIDPQGLALHFTYDATLRLVAVTDAIGLVTTLSYELATDSTKITTVTDPFGRIATITYNDAGELASITDVIGMRSSFAYGPGDFITSMTTPYGTTLFTHEADASQTIYSRFIQATDPLGGTERVEFRWSTTAIASTAPTGQVPTGFSAFNQNLDHYNSLYWDKRAMALYPGDVSKATITHWLMYTYVSYTPIFYSHAFSTSVPHSVKRPLENRVWYAYADEDATGNTVGSWIQPTKTARVLDDGSSQVWQAAYNGMGQVTQATDPLGRQQTLTYAANGIDLLEVRQTTSGLTDLLTSFSNYTTRHRPQTRSDAAGRTTTATYNTASQVVTQTNAKSETTTYAYDTNGYLLSVTGPVSGASTTFTYDSYGRLRTTTGSDGYATTADYDGLDRPTRVTYPDGTSESVVYTRLDVAQQRDRLGRITRLFYDPLRRRTATRDPLGRTVTQQWCACGSLDALIDAKGQATTWERDVQDRVTREVRADGTTATVYTYEATTSRPKTVTDPKGQVTTSTYALDDARTQLAYTNAGNATPTVSFTYDANYRRLATMVDGTGTTIYTYKAAGTLGAMRVASVDGPLTNDTITYDYDELGRPVGRAINSVGLTLTYDPLGRLNQEVNPLGTFAYTYVGATGRVASTTYPNGQTTSYSYFGNTGDRRLQTIHHKKPNATTLSKFDYTYDVVGNIQTWTQQADSAAPTVQQFRYDTADQLTGATKQTTDPTPAVLKRFAYGYDPAGNRTSEQIDDAVVSASHDRLNRLTSQSVGGAMRIVGTLDEPGTVTVQGKPVTVDAANRFQGTVPVTTGTTMVAVTATDASGNQATKRYEIDQSGAGSTLTYDANGNLTSDGTRTFEWDAVNRLVAVNIGTHRSEFTYNGHDRRARIVEKDSGATTRDTQLIWDGTEIAEERLSTGEVNRFFTDGEQHNGTARYLTRDHLGSIREVTDTAGTVVARNDYDPYGRLTRIAGTEDSRFGYTGHLAHTPSGLALALYRAYDPALGRWLSEDPAGMPDGPNRSSYVLNRPTSAYDPDGRIIWVIAIPPIVEALAWAAAYTGGTLAALWAGEKLSDALLAEHTKDPRPSTKEKHEQGDERRKRDRGGEKSDWPNKPDADPPRKRPNWYPKTGPWPPKPPNGGMCEK